MKFMHLSDLHLGSILKINSSNLSFIKDVEINGVYSIFTKAILSAIENRVDFVIISGDIYDKDSYYVRANKVFMDGIGMLNEKKIQVFIAHGNHDPLKGLKNLYKVPENLHVFPWKEPKTYEIKDTKGNTICRIVGQSYEKREEGRKIFTDFSLPEDSFNIGVLHTALSLTDKSYVPCSLKELEEVKGINYWALGHIHKNKVIKQNKQTIVYPGIPQGRDFGETGWKGCYIADVENKNVNLTFIPLGDYVYEEIEINIKEYNFTNISDIIDVMRDKISNLKGDALGYIIRWSINGRGKINDLLKEDEEDIAKNIIESLNMEFGSNSPFVITQEVNINTGREINISKENKLYMGIENTINKLYQDESFNKEFKRKLGNIFDSNEEREEEDFTKVKVDKYVMECILNNAKEIILDKYIEREDSSEI